jgi:UDP-N-acetylglucosamine:LPS N-acetylglucosamine transferase
MKTIGIFTTGYGHESIAQAIASKIESKSKHKYRIKIFTRKLTMDSAYNSLYRFTPSLLGPTFHLSSNIIKKDKNARKLLDNLLMLGSEDEIRSFVKKNKIDLCISTYFVCNPALERLQEEKNIPFINVATDPRTISPLLISDTAVANLVFDEQAFKHYKNKNLKQAGWFVGDRFEAEYDKSKIRKKLKINDDLTILIASGSQGSNTVLKILPSIINCQKKVNFIIACGNNEFLYNNTLGIKQSLKKLSSSQAKVIPLGYTKDLHLYMQASDLVIGKAGPNTIFESVASETAFFAITHIHGQEDGNLEIIKNYKIGFVEENTKKANQKLSALIKNPQKIRAFTENIRKLKKYNQKSIEVLLETITPFLD